MKQETITTQFALNDDYWAGSLRTLYRYKRPFRHYQPLIGAAVLAFGIILAVILPGTRILPFAVILVGVIETIEPFIIQPRLHYFVPAEAFSQVTQMAEVTARFRAANVKTRIFDPRVRG